MSQANTNIRPSEGGTRICACLCLVFQTTSKAPGAKDRPEPPTNGWDLEGIDDGVDNAVDEDDGAEVKDEISFAGVADVIQVSRHHEHNQPTCNMGRVHSLRRVTSCSITSKFPQLYVPTVLRSHSSIFPQLYVLTNQRSHSSTFPQLYVPTALCSHRSTFSQLYVPQLHVPTALRSHSSMFYVPTALRPHSFMFPQLYVLTALFPQLYVLIALCSHSSTSSQLYVPTALCPHSSMSPQLCAPTALCPHSSMSSSHSSMFPQIYVPLWLFTLAASHCSVFLLFFPTCLRSHTGLCFHCSVFPQPFVLTPLFVPPTFRFPVYVPIQFFLSTVLCFHSSLLPHFFFLIPLFVPTSLRSLTSVFPHSSLFQ